MSNPTPDPFLSQTGYDVDDIGDFDDFETALDGDDFDDDELEIEERRARER